MKASDFPIATLVKKDFPPLLREIPDFPKELRLRGKLPMSENKLLAVVGSRKYTSYGKEACEMLIDALSGTSVTIVSGLALGIDAIAHNAALQAGLQTIAVPGSGLSDTVLYPRTNFQIAQEILKNDGGLLSEFPDDAKARPEYFPQRNRIMAGMSHATLVIEASERSGTLITARLATEYNRDVCVVPRDIFSNASSGSNNLLHDGAYPVTKPEDLYEILDIKREPLEDSLQHENLSPEEKNILELLVEPKTKDELIEFLPYEANTLNILLSEMEIKGLLKEAMGKVARV